MKSLLITLRRQVCLLVLLLVSASWVTAFSPYENHLLNGSFYRVGLIAKVIPGKVQELEELLNSMSIGKMNTLNWAEVENLNVFIRAIDQVYYAFCYFESAQTQTDASVTALLDESPFFKSMEPYLIPHPRAKASGHIWQRMECINHIATDEAFPHQAKTIQKMALMSGLRPEKEAAYRHLHQTTWPGVVDGMIKSNYRNWTTFLIEFGDELRLFTYFEYIGENIEADNKVMAADPVTNRWWKYTEPCLIDLAGEGNWSGMQSLFSN